MSNLVLSKIFIYPIKSLGGISLQSTKAEERGLQYDRRWMLIDNKNCFMTQREFPQMTLINIETENDYFLLSHQIKNRF